MLYLFIIRLLIFQQQQQKKRERDRNKIKIKYSLFVKRQLIYYELIKNTRYSTYRSIITIDRVDLERPKVPIH